MTSKIEGNSGLFEKGREKTGGRQKGTMNKETADIKEVISQLITAISDNDGVKKLVDDMKVDKPQDLVKALVSLAPKDLNIKADIKHNPLADELKQMREKKV